MKFIGLSANVGYKVDVRNGKIVNAYGTWHWGVLWSVEPGAPVFSDYSSHVSGVASVGLKDFGFHTSFTLKGFIGTDNQFHTTIIAP